MQETTTAARAGARRARRTPAWRVGGALAAVAALLGVAAPAVRAQPAASAATMPAAGPPSGIWQVAFPAGADTIWIRFRLRFAGDSIVIPPTTRCAARSRATRCASSCSACPTARASTSRACCATA